MECRGGHLHHPENDQIIEAERMLGNDAHVNCRFTPRACEVEMLNGQAVVVLNIAAAGT